MLSDKDFKRGHHNPKEGGPKGLDLTNDETLMVVTCEEQPLAFFQARLSHPITFQPVRPRPNVSDVDRLRDLIVRYLTMAQDRSRHETEAMRRAGEYERNEVVALARELRAMRRSRSWRLTSPLRKANRILRNALGRK